MIYIYIYIYLNLLQWKTILIVGFIAASWGRISCHLPLGGSHFSSNSTVLDHESQSVIQALPLEGSAWPWAGQASAWI